MGVVSEEYPLEDDRELVTRLNEVNEGDREGVRVELASPVEKE